MSDYVEVVVKIPANKYGYILSDKYRTSYPGKEVRDIVRAGKVLPAGHGPLFDMNSIKSAKIEDSSYCASYYKGSEVSLEIDADILVEADTVNKPTARYGFEFEIEDGVWSIICFEPNGKVNKYFTSGEDDYDTAIAYYDLYLDGEGNRYKYVIPDYLIYYDNVRDILALKDGPIEALNDYCVYQKRKYVND